MGKDERQQVISVWQVKRKKVQTLLFKALYSRDHISKEKLPNMPRE
jgi:hypothetical protein